jgi:hypothetical protein
MQWVIIIIIVIIMIIIFIIIIIIVIFMIVILQSVLRQVRSLFQSEFFIECDLVLPLSIYSIFSFP